MDGVRFLVSILTCLIMLHSACMMRCMGESSGHAQQSAVPPCHQSEESTEQVPMTSTTCSEGPALEAKSHLALKCSLEIAGWHNVVPTPLSTADFLAQEDPPQASPISPSLARHSVLRV
jgi:hypothetical protein